MLSGFMLHLVMDIKNGFEEVIVQLLRNEEISNRKKIHCYGSKRKRRIVLHFTE